MFLQSLPLFKYPRTPHLEGSRLQEGDDASDQMPLKRLAGQYMVVKEKVDGANSAVSLSDAVEVLLQSRGHYLAGRPVSFFDRHAGSVFGRRQQMGSYANSGGKK